MLQLFLTAKTHKSVCPLRVIPWERQLATPDLFRSEFSRWGLENVQVKCATTAFSALLCSTRTSCPVLFAKGCKFAGKFQSVAGVNSQQFLGSLQFHSKSIAILFDNGTTDCMYVEDLLLHPPSVKSSQLPHTGRQACSRQDQWPSSSQELQVRTRLSGAHNLDRETAKVTSKFTTLSKRTVFTLEKP